LRLRSLPQLATAFKSACVPTGGLLRYLAQTALVRWDVQVKAFGDFFGLRVVPCRREDAIRHPLSPLAQRITLTARHSDANRFEFAQRLRSQILFLPRFTIGLRSRRFLESLLIMELFLLRTGTRGRILLLASDLVEDKGVQLIQVVIVMRVGLHGGVSMRVAAEDSMVGLLGLLEPHFVLFNRFVDFSEL